MAQTENFGEEEISLLDLLAVLLRYRWMIIIVTAVAAVFSVFFSIITIVLPSEKSPLPNQYTAQAELLISESQGGIGQVLASSGLSGMASLAGVDLSSSSSNSSLAQYMLESNVFFDAVAEKFDIARREEITKNVRSATRRVLKKRIKSAFDQKSGVITISCTDTDASFAKDVACFAVEWLELKFDELGLDSNKIQKENLERGIRTSYAEITRIQKEMKKLGLAGETGGSAWELPSVTSDSTKLQLELSTQTQVFAQLSGQYELLKIQMQSESPVFQVLQMPDVPDEKSGPGRGKICIIITFAAFFISVFMAFFLNAVRNIKADPGAMKKLSGVRR